MQKISTPARFYPVRMSMEVSFTAHSHIIGRAGSNINSVMKETSTKIHFPDENRMPGEKKSNEVTISGEMVNVEKARRRIRELIPVEYVVECRTEMLDFYGRQALVKDFAVLYGVLVRLNEKTTAASATIRGSQQEIGKLKEAVNHLIKLNKNSDTLVSMKMEISAGQLSVMRANFPFLEFKYSTVFVIFNLTKNQDDHHVVWIRGSIDGVYLAKMALMELLPTKLMFHVHAIHLTFGVEERKLAKRLDVLVKMEPSTKSNNFLLQIISYEKNAGNIYEFRRQILRRPNPNGQPSIGFRLSLPQVQNPELSLFPTACSSAMLQPPFRQVVEKDHTVTHLNSENPLLLPSIGSPSNDCSDDLTEQVNQTIIPASICSLRFDKNSFRQLYQLLVDMDLNDYCELFLANEVDLAMFTTLGDDDLKSIGVISYRARRIMLHAISELKNQPISCPIENASRFNQF